MPRSKPSLNGDTLPEGIQRARARNLKEQAKKKAAKKKRDIKADVESVASAAQPSAEPPTRGRLASEIPVESIEWLYQPWFPRSMLSMVIGLAGVGKSSLVAWLVSQAGRAIILPGFEEKAGIMTIPRLMMNGANLRHVRFFDDKNYQFPRDKRFLAAAARAWDAQLIVIDPIDSYMEDGLSENAGPDVRSYLESFVWIAEESEAAVVCVRHPGKDKKNAMPGSRQWGNVPRSIVELFKDGGTPAKLLIRHYKDSLGQKSHPRQYTLPQDVGRPPRFMLGDWVDPSVSDLAGAVDGPTGQRRLLEACRLIQHMFGSNEQPGVQDLVNECRKYGIGEHARDEAKRVLGIRSINSGPGTPFVMKRTIPDWPKWLLDAES